MVEQADDIDMAWFPEGLDPAALADAPFGAIEVDGAGVILACGEVAARLFGTDPASAIGRDLFRDVAPSTDLPAFRGRFLAGLRAGRMAARFTFVVGFDPQPVRIAVEMRDGDGVGQYLILIRVLGTLPPTVQHSLSTLAAEAVDRRVRAEPIDAGICEREPIHLPGAVQPHAVMIALDPATLAVEACSDNAPELFGRTMAVLLDESATALLPADLCTALASLAVEGGDPARPLRRRAAINGALHEITAHVHGGRLVVELELLPDRPDDFGATSPLRAQDAVARLREAEGLVAAAQVCVDEIRAMTGFERVLVYRFDEEWNGEAIAEAVASEWGDSLLGLRFPASDIPAQARALYTRSPARFVVDRDASPAALRAAPRAGNRSVDLSFAQSRALSPVHLEYQRNLGVNGSMSASIIVEGRLWGLVIGHHRRPLYVPPDSRALATIVTEAFALRVHEMDSRALWEQRQAHLAAQQALFRQMAGSDDYVAAVLHEGVTLDRLFASDGAAVSVDEGVFAIGATPPADAIAAIVAWLRQGPLAEARSFATDTLGELCAAAAPWRELASGLLAATIDSDRRNVLLWFRREIPATVAWGGDPNKPVLGDQATNVVLPRRSFERWVVEHRGHAAPWAGWEQTAAETFAGGIEGVILRQGRRIATLTAQQAELTEALAQKDILAREVDHRVKNSLQIVAAVMLMQARKVDDAGARAALEETYARVMSVARVHDSLQQATDAETVEIGDTLRQLCQDLLTGMAGGGRTVAVHAETRLMVSSRTAVALSLIATELVTNALKYAYAPGEDGEVAVHLEPREGDGLSMRICDNGRGLPEGWEKRAEQRGSGGLGMRIITAMLAQIDAKMEVESGGASGACFTVRV